MKTKQKVGTELPGAWIVNPKDRGRKSIKSGNIYLQNDENFEIEIFNPLKESVLADIRLNGQSISKTGLVVKPGQRIYLDCFIDDKKKFIFQTYEVENSTEVKESIANNGLMEVFFYKEETINLQNWPDRFRETIIREYYPVYIDRYPYWYRPYYNNLVLYSGNLNTTIGGACTTGSISFGGTTATNAVTSTSYISGDSSNLSSSWNANISFTNCSNNSTIETGRVEKGQISNQQFTEVDMNFEKNYIHHIVYQLLPNSKKPVEIENKKNDKFTDSKKSAELLLLLKELKDIGIITDDEFLEKKKELLSRI